MTPTAAKERRRVDERFARSVREHLRQIWLTISVSLKPQSQYAISMVTRVARAGSADRPRQDPADAESEHDRDTTKVTAFDR
jgi:hypothetical protein